jgi:hypothetical protein
VRQARCIDCAGALRTVLAYTNSIYKMRRCPDDARASAKSARGASVARYGSLCGEELARGLVRAERGLDARAGKLQDIGSRGIEGLGPVAVTQGDRIRAVPQCH